MQNQTPGPGALQIQIADDHMEATAAFKGAANPAFNEATLFQALADRHVVHGVQPATVTELAKQIREGKGLLHLSAVVARGTPPGVSRDPQVEFLVDEEPEVKMREDGGADFRNTRRFKTVKPDQPLARIHPAVQGADGRNVIGEPIPAHTPLPLPFLAGESVQQMKTEDGIIECRSAIEGIFKRTADRFFVTPELIIEGNAGMETGNLSCRLTIVIRGNVQRGMEIQAGKDLQVEGFVETGFLRVSGKLQVTGGINSAHQGTILCGGDLYADFIENSHIICDGNLHLNHYCLASTIVVQGTTGFQRPDSIIAGGEIIHHGDLSVARIGNANQIRTVFHPGVHYHNQQMFHALHEELQKLETELHALAEYLREMKVRLARTPAAQMAEETRQEARERVQKYHKLGELVVQQRAAMQAAAHSRKNANPVHIRVTDVVLPGTEFHFNKNVERVKAPLHSVLITFAPNAEEPTYSALG